ncbi:hypothetical protein GCM10008018_63040 [Paenibacillus marchantiophytorum]|uniref:Uncharacterized protein n=1 Tax=Paenibacillus marchantiophytorum TaxID=1619310 RepID=A0ABQ1FEA5_9BACL|nr:hypothetical protein GCM10008018_63040 [Paenibacillus marchantiophytorum]
MKAAETQKWAASDLTAKLPKCKLQMQLDYHTNEGLYGFNMQIYSTRTAFS